MMQTNGLKPIKIILTARMELVWLSMSLHFVFAKQATFLMVKI